jgi:hypothetical protein
MTIGSVYREVYGFEKKHQNKKKGGGRKKKKRRAKKKKKKKERTCGFWSLDHCHGAVGLRLEQ